MKLSVFLCSVLLAVPVWAQEAPKGLDLLLAASNLVTIPDDLKTGGEKLTAVEILKRKRAQVVQNAPALAKLREALKFTIVGDPETEFEQNLQKFGSVDKLVDQLRIESEVYVADANWLGALNSRLTAFEFGAAFVKAAPIVGIYSARSADFLGRKKIEIIVLKADASTLRSASDRLKAIDAKRISYAEYTEFENANILSQMRKSFADEKQAVAFKAQLSTPEGRKEIGVREDEAAEMATLTPETYVASITQVFEARIARDRLPYSRAVKTELPKFKGSFAQMMARGLNDQRQRFDFETNLANQRLLEAAIELRAIKLETGAYPEIFTAPLDPFGDSSRLIYQRAGDSYLIYSIGPDGRDGGGEEIQTVEINRATGAKTVTGDVKPNSIGDILGPVF